MRPARASARTSLAAAAALIVAVISPATAAPAGDAPTAVQVMGGDDLVGTVVALRGPDGARYEIEVAATGETYFRAGTREPVVTYILTWTSDRQPTPQPLCTAGVNEAILFTGDRYDATTKTVTATGAAAAGWLSPCCGRTPRTTTSVLPLLVETCAG